MVEKKMIENFEKEPIWLVCSNCNEYYHKSKLNAEKVCVKCTANIRTDAKQNMVP